MSQQGGQNGATKPDIIQVVPPNSRWLQFKEYLLEEATFFRLHLTAFIVIPLIFSAILWGSNGQFRIDYVDSLFLCYSAMTVTGLTTVNLSTLTAWQQVILYILMLVGDITMVSWLMVLVRREYFKNKCEYVVTKERKNMFSDREKILASISSPINAFRPASAVPPRPSETVNVNVVHPTPAGTLSLPQQTRTEGPPSEKHEPDDIADIISDVKNFTSSPDKQIDGLLLSPTSATSGNLPEQRQSPRNIAFSSAITQSPRPAASRYNSGGGRERVAMGRRTTTYHTTNTARTGATRQTTILAPPQPKYQGFGGFPGPVQILQRIFKRTAPRTYRTIERKLTLPLTMTQEANTTPWLRGFDLFVGRNSDFHTDSLSDEEVEEIGGVEFRALNFLSWVVPLYLVGSQLFTYLLFAPWLSSTTKYDPIFEAQPRLVKKPWFSLFQTMAAYTGGGLSLVDLGMVPFQDAYLMSFGLMYAILAGNHALPIFLRLIIWVSYRFSTVGSELHGALSFLLDHPRRCFVYLFPSHQTWFLVFCLLLFSLIEWVGFEVLNIGLPIYTALETGPRIVTGLFQGLAARASGFSIVPISALAPSVQFLYVVMMYIAIYPVALSIRTTNVYEERSLGVFEEEFDENEEEPDGMSQLEPRQRIGRYVGWHLRRQLSNDIWWLVCAVFVIAIIERHNILDERIKWFDLFRVLFELVSAFGGIGLSLGVPYDNFSFSGTMRPLSKIVIIIIMVKGRHRGLPVAVDRAVLLPSELASNPQQRKPTSAGIGQRTRTLDNSRVQSMP